MTELLATAGYDMIGIDNAEDMLEIAIISLKCSLRDDFDEFKEFFELRSWEPKTVESSENEEAAESSDEPVADNQTADLPAIDEGESKE